MATTPMVAVSVWGGAHDGARLLVAQHRISQPRELEFLGHSYVVGHDDRRGWQAVFTGHRRRRP